MKKKRNKYFTIPIFSRKLLFKWDSVAAPRPADHQPPGHLPHHRQEGHLRLPPQGQPQPLLLLKISSSSKASPTTFRILINGSNFSKVQSVSNQTLEIKNKKRYSSPYTLPPNKSLQLQGRNSLLPPHVLSCPPSGWYTKYFQAEALGTESLPVCQRSVWRIVLIKQYRFVLIRTDEEKKRFSLLWI